MSDERDNPCRPASIDGVKNLTIFLVILPKNESLGTIEGDYWDKVSEKNLSQMAENALASNLPQITSFFNGSALVIQ